MKLTRLALYIVVLMGLLCPAPIFSATPSEDFDRLDFNDADKALPQLMPNRALDGNLLANYILVDSELYRRLGTPCLIGHDLLLNENGAPYSSWRCLGLNTFLVPEGRDLLRLQLPSREIVLFKKSQVTSEFPERSERGYFVRRANDDEFEVKSLNNVILRYRRGCLAGVNVPGLGNYKVACRGAQIESVLMDGENIPEIQVEFDDAQRPAKIRVFGIVIAILKWLPNGELEEWNKQDGAGYHFKYQNGLLCEIAYTGFDPLRIEWAENKGWRRGDSKWPGPIQLTRFGNRCYRLSLESRGWGTEVFDDTNKKLYEICYNPLTSKTIVVKDSQVYTLRRK